MIDVCHNCGRPIERHNFREHEAHCGGVNRGDDPRQVEPENYKARARIDAYLSTVADCIDNARKANTDGLPMLTTLELRTVPYFVEECRKLAAELAE